MAKKFNKSEFKADFENAHNILVDIGLIDEDYILHRLIDGDLEVCESSHPDAVVLEGESFLVRPKWQREMVKAYRSKAFSKVR